MYMHAGVCPFGHCWVIFKKRCLCFNLDQNVKIDEKKYNQASLHMQPQERKTNFSNRVQFFKATVVNLCR